jgi:hypothetical protein
MQFFDYDEDLSLFNSLMEATEGAEESAPDESAPAEEDAPAEKTTKSKAKKGIPRTKLGSAISGEIRKVLKTKEMNLKLFRATYWPNQCEPFVLCTVDNYEVSNDPMMTQYVKQTDDTHITINLTALIRACTSDDLMAELEHISNWQKVASDTFGSYRAAVLLALDGQKGSRKFPSLATRINRGLKDVDSDKNTIVDPEEEKELKKQAREEKKAQKAQAEQNPQEEQQPQEQQNPQEEQKPQEQQPPQNDPDTPSDEDDPKALYRKIRKNFQENYKDDLELECKNNADSLDDEGKDDLVDKYYDKAMEDFPDVYDNDVQEKVQDLVASYVSLYTKTNEPKSTESKDPDDDDMNWGPKTKPKDNQSDNTNTTTNNKPKDNPKDKGYFNWLNNTINNWNQEGVLNQQANPKNNIEASHFIRDAKDWLNRRRKKKGTSESNQHQNTDRILDED